MNQREIGELRRRLKPEKNAISKIYGCYVNSNKQLISYLDTSLGIVPQDEAEKYLTLLRRSCKRTCSTLSFPPVRWRTVRSTGCSPSCGRPV